MTFEHFALNVSDVPALVAWYREHLGLTVAREVGGATQTHFLADDTGRTMLEVYDNPAAPVLDFAAMDPLGFHVAFTVTEAETEKTRLLAAGATLAKDETTPDGSRLVMLRDPWGIAVQLCQRTTPMPLGPA